MPPLLLVQPYTERLGHSLRFAAAVSIFIQKAGMPLKNGAELLCSVVVEVRER